MDSRLTLTKREACERRPVRRLIERRASCPRMRRLTGKRTSCSTQDLCISSMQTVQITVCKLKPDFGAKPRDTVSCQNMQLKINSTIYFL